MSFYLINPESHWKIESLNFFLCDIEFSKRMKKQFIITHVLWSCEIALQIENSALQLIAFTIDSRRHPLQWSAFTTELLSD